MSEPLSPGKQGLLVEFYEERLKPADVFEMVRRRDEILFQIAALLDEVIAMGIMTPQEQAVMGRVKRLVQGRRGPESA